MDAIQPQHPAINSWSPDYLDSLYKQWKSAPDSVDERWRHFFAGFELASAGGTTPAEPRGSANEVTRQAKVNSLIYHYRDIGHLMANLDPLGRKRERPENLRLEAFDLSEADLTATFFTPIPGMPGPLPLREIITFLEGIYCQTLGAEYMHIQNTAERRWIQDRLEGENRLPDLSQEEKHNLLRKLHQAEIFENFLHTRYVGQKRFSLEGAETTIALLWYGLEAAALHGVREVVLGMAHRGRLNVLANILNKAYDEIFAEFEDNYEEEEVGGGDVKYHKGYSSNFMTTRGDLLYLTLAANPSHLEAVDPVVEGRCRAKQRLAGDKDRSLVAPILIHGDAAFAGQGIVAETLQMVKLPGYTTGGTVHLIVNNQIGFTTDPEDARSSVYCTDVAKMVQAPIFHVNGEDPEMCAKVVRLAFEYRQAFHKDVVIDMWCYRKYGHNEGDEPAFTQPQMYEIIRSKESVRAIYTKRLTEDGIISEDEVKQMQTDLEEVLDAAQEHGRENPVPYNQSAFRKKWTGFRSSFSFDKVDTAVAEDKLLALGEACSRWPDDFKPHRKVRRLYDERWKALSSGKPFDWGTAEMLAYATLLDEGIAVRMTGQDTRRGTFSHRHAVITDIETEAEYTPLNHLSTDQERFCIYDSPLSEASVLGFEYGYSLGDPQMLILWEAQFGDFANGAQVIIDQFITSAEAKWDRYSGLVMLLPHGYEGQGPEHSSARLERFLQLASDDNIQVANLTTPAQYFHIIRRQMKRAFRKPLIIMSPKSLLRHPKATSVLKDLSEGTFQEFLDDSPEDRGAVRRVLLCSGKVYLDLAARRDEVNATETAIIRVEQLYPFHAEMVAQLLARYPDASELCWVQEEPKNMGAWSFISDAIEEKLGFRLTYIGRPASPTPASGSPGAHRLETQQLLEAAIPSPARVSVVAG